MIAIISRLAGSVLTGFTVRKYQLCPLSTPATTLGVEVGKRAGHRKGR
jgi:hypothetical protein